jgi:hypothetical protein
LSTDEPGLMLAGMLRALAVPVACAVALLAAAPGVAAARGGGDDQRVRTAGTCSGTLRAELRLRARDGGIEAELEVEQVPSGSRWRVVVVQERRVAWRGTAVGRSGALRVARRLREHAGADTVSIRVTRAGGVACRATATLAGA